MVQVCGKVVVIMVLVDQIMMVMVDGQRVIVTGSRVEVVKVI